MTSRPINKSILLSPICGDPVTCKIICCFFARSKTTSYIFVLHDKLVPFYKADPIEHKFNLFAKLFDITDSEEPVSHNAFMGINLLSLIIASSVIRNPSKLDTSYFLVNTIRSFIILVFF